MLLDDHLPGKTLLVKKKKTRADQGGDGRHMRIENGQANKVTDEHVRLPVAVISFSLCSGFISVLFFCAKARGKKRKKTRKPPN